MNAQRLSFGDDNRGWQTCSTRAVGTVEGCRGVEIPLGQVRNHPGEQTREEGVGRVSKELGGRFDGTERGHELQCTLLGR